MKKIFIASLTLLSSTFGYSNEIEIGFSPEGTAQELIIKAINDATESIDVAAYSFTSKPVSQALLYAKKRGVLIRVIADRESNQNYTATTFISKNGIAVRLNSNYKIMHNKFMIIDGHSLETGSFNYTASANSRNAENVIYIANNNAVADKYETEFIRLWNESTPITR